MLQWKQEWHGQTALLIDGARRIGKSWIAEEFARNEYESHIIIDFNNVEPQIIELFEEYLTNLDEFFSRLSLYTNTFLVERGSVIIFDEVQMYPRARAAIKYLVKDGRYDYIETGSLVSINHNVKNIVIPSEEVRIDMHPMDFQEFMWATDGARLYDFATKQFEALTPMGQALHRKMMESLRAYILVGGMPQAVEAYVKTRDFRHVDNVKRTIIALYRNDISKYAEGNAPKVTKIFDEVPAALQKHEKRFRPSMVGKGKRSRDIYNAMFWLNESRVLNFCYGTTEPSVALALNRQDAKVKLYMGDTGLLISMAFDREEMIIDKVYEKILRGKLEFNKGMLTENFVAQELTAAGQPLYFYSNSTRYNAEDRMEIDFLILKRGATSRHNVCPIEVKSAAQYALTSLMKCKKKFASQIGDCYVLHTGDIKQEEGVIFLPLYMAGML